MSDLTFSSLVSAPADLPVSAELARLNRQAVRALKAGDLPAYIAICDARDALESAEPVAVVFTSIA